MKTRTALPLLTVWWDPREKMVIEPPDGVELVKVSLPTFDYTTELLQLVGGIERKSVADIANCMTHDGERFDDNIRRMRDYRFKGLVCEGNIDAIWREHQIHPHAVLGRIASYFARADVPVLFAGTRPAAARLICGILRRWEERLTAERAEEAGAA